MNQIVRRRVLKEGEIIPISFDYIFTNIFNNPKNVIILENFLSCYLDVDISKIKGKVTILSRDLILAHKKEASKQIDLLVDIEGEKINIEMQNKMSNGIMNRNVVFACKVHAEQLKTGDKRYTKIGKTLQINLTRKTNEIVRESFYLTNERGKILTKKLQIDLVDMEIAKKICYTKDETKLARWCMAFLATTKEEFEKSLGNDLMEDEASNLLREEVDKYSKDDEVVVMYSKYTKEELERQSIEEETQERIREIEEKMKLSEEKIKKSEEKIRESEEKIRKSEEKVIEIEGKLKKAENIGIKRGEQKKQLEIAQNMLKENMDKHKVAKITGLALHEIEKLIVLYDTEGK